MKTSTKILLTYGSILVAVQLVFLVNSLVQRPELNRIGIEMAAILDTTKVRHYEVDISEARYGLDPIPRKGKIGPKLSGYNSYRRFYFGANLKTSHVSGDTLFIKAYNDDLSWRHTSIPEIRSFRLITPTGEVLDTDYPEIKKPKAKNSNAEK